MNRKLSVFMLLIVLFVVSLFVRGETKSASVEKDSFSAPVNGNVLDVYYFYGQGCPHCAQVEPFLAEMEQKYPLQLHRFDIYNNRSSFSLFDDYSSMYGLPLDQRAVPTLFVCDTYIVGDSQILNGFEEVVKKALRESSSTEQAFNLEMDNEEIAPASGSLSIVAVTIAALVSSVSPCSIAILVFLVGARVLVANRRKRALKVGLAFCLSVFIASFLFGLGLFTLVQFSGFSSVFSLLVGLVAILTGIFYLKDVFWYGSGGFVMEVPRSLKPLLMKMLKGVTSPLGAFLMGFIVCCFELPCTGGPYLLILGQLANNATRLQAVPLLLYYNLLFVLPLIMISLILYSGFFSLERIRQWNDRNKRLLRLIGGLTVVILGVLVIPASQVLQLIQLFLRGFKVIGLPVLGIMLLYLVLSFAKRKNLVNRLMQLPGPAILLLSLLVAVAFIDPYFAAQVGGLESGSHPSSTRSLGQKFETSSSSCVTCGCRRSANLGVLGYSSLASSGAPGYCPSTGGSTAFEFISDVKYEQTPSRTLIIKVSIWIANPTGCVVGEPCPVYDASPENVNAWIDWNSDGDWYDSGEKVLDKEVTGYAGINYQGTLTTSEIVTIPDTGALSSTWMRVNLGWAHDPNDPCEASWTYGNVVDKKVTIKEEKLFTWPVKGPITTSPLGRFRTPRDGTPPRLHDGIDICAEPNTPVKAAADGVVYDVGWENEKKPTQGYGKRIYIKHEIKGKTYYTVYAHLNEWSVSPGDKVKQGQIIGKTGRSGNAHDSKQSHLHFAILDKIYKVNGTKHPLNPESFLGPDPLINFEENLPLEGELCLNSKDYVVDTDGDGLYNYLIIETNVSISIQGTYMITGELNRNNIEIDSTGNYTHLTPGIHTIQLHFDGITINLNKINGPYNTNFGLYDEFGNQLDHQENAYNTTAYNYASFQPSPLKLTNHYSDYGTDTDDNGLFDYLVIDIEVDATQTGNYTLEGYLYDLNDNLVGWANNYTQLTAGVHDIQLYFDTKLINVDGPYRLKDIILSAENGVTLDYKEDAYSTAAYVVSTFQPSIVNLTGYYSDYGTDANNNGLFDYLTVEVGANITTAGNYTIEGMLYDRNGEPIVWTSNSTELGAGVHNMSLNFDGKSIYTHGMNGPYNFTYILISDENGNIVNYATCVYETLSYNYIDFAPLLLLTGEYSDYGIDTNGNGLFDNLIIEIGVNVSDNGNVFASGRLMDSLENEISWSSNSSFFYPGHAQILLSFNGSEIYDNGVNGPYYLKDVFVYHQLDVEQYEYIYTAFTTNAYQHTEFEHIDIEPPITTISLSGDLGDNGWFMSDVTVTLSATDDTQVDKTEYSINYTAWITYSTPFNITNEGHTVVHYKSTDKTGNSETIKMEEIKIDKSTPLGSVIINNGDSYTTSTSVTLTLTANDATSGVYQVRYSNDGAWDTELWESPSATRAWTLTSGDGTKTVYYQIRDNAGLLSSTYSDTIILQSPSPSPSPSLSGPTPSPSPSPSPEPTPSPTQPPTPTPSPSPQPTPTPTPQPPEERPFFLYVIAVAVAFALIGAIVFMLKKRRQQ